MILIWGWLGYIALNAGLFVAAEFLRPKPDMKDAEPKGLGDFNFPTTSTDRPVPVVFGDVKLTGANLVWYGDFTTEKLTETVETGLFTEEDRVSGHKYHIGMHMILCQGQLDEIYRIESGGETIFDSTVQGRDEHGSPLDPDNKVAGVNEPNIFGGDRRGGGVAGEFHYQTGESSQEPHSYLKTNLNPSSTNGDIPAFRGWSGIIFKGSSDTSHTGGYIGRGQTVKNFTFYVQRFPDNLGLFDNTVNGDSNPAEIIYEILTNEEWGMGVSDNFINKASFEDSATKLSQNDIGLSFVWNRQDSIKGVLNKVLRHIDGNLLPNPETGELELSLVLDDYNVGDIPVFDDSNFVSLNNFSREAYDETVNEIKIKYKDRENDSKDTTMSVQNLANFKTQGKPSSTTVEYPFVRNSTTANALAHRDIRTMTLPLAKCTIEVNRDAFDLRPGDPFVLNWDPLGLEQIVMRVQDFDLGTIDDETISIDAIQDHFSMGDTYFSDPPGTSWDNPLDFDNWSEIYDYYAWKAPYWMNLREGFSGDRNVVWLAVAGDQIGHDFDVYKNEAGGGMGSAELLMGSRTFLPRATVDGVYPQETDYYDQNTGITLREPERIGRVSAGSMENSLIYIFNREEDGFGGYNQVNHEIMSFGEITKNTDGGYQLNNIERGLLDTVPLEHPDGSVVMFIDKFYVLDELLSDAGSTDFYFGTRTPNRVMTNSEIENNVQSVAGDPDQQDPNARPYLPIPPGNIQFTDHPNTKYPDLSTGQALGTITWNERNRNSDIITQHDGSDYIPRDNTKYFIEINGTTYDVTNEGGSWDYTQSIEENQNSGELYDTLDVRIFSQYESYESYKSQRRFFDRT